LERVGERLAKTQAKRDEKRVDDNKKIQHRTQQFLARRTVFGFEIQITLRRKYNFCYLCCCEKRGALNERGKGEKKLNYSPWPRQYNIDDDDDGVDFILLWRSLSMTLYIYTEFFLNSLSLPACVLLFCAELF
jgi:hypothetical protein